MQGCHKILIVRFSSIGDIILASPLIRSLRTAYPAAQIDFLVKSEYAVLLHHNPHLSSILELHSDTADELWTLMNSIRKTGYDAVIDIHNSLRSRVIRWFSGARRIGVVDKRVIRRFILVNLHRNVYDSVVPVAKRYLEAARIVGAGDDEQPLEFFVPEETGGIVHAKLTQKKIPSRAGLIAFVPGAKHATKRWPPDRFVELGRRLSEEYPDARIVVLGAKEEREYCDDIVQLLNASVGSGKAHNFSGQLTLVETASLFDRCDLVVTNDTGLMHLAAARGRSVVAIFGSTVREFGFFPYGVPNRVVERPGLSCRPCSHIGLDQCPEGHFKCMKDISAEDALAQITGLMKEIFIEQGAR